MLEKQQYYVKLYTNLFLDRMQLGEVETTVPSK